MLYGAADVEKDDLVELCEFVRAEKYQRCKLRPVQTAVRKKDIAKRVFQRCFQVRVLSQELVIKRVAVDNFAAARGNFLQERRLAAASRTRNADRYHVTPRQCGSPRPS